MDTRWPKRWTRSWPVSSVQAWTGALPAQPERRSGQVPQRHRRAMEKAGQRKAQGRDHQLRQAAAGLEGWQSPLTATARAPARIVCLTDASPGARTTASVRACQQESQEGATCSGVAAEMDNGAMTFDSPPLPTRRADLIERLRAPHTYDIAIIGGGATGLGVALDAAARGFSVVVVESHDFAKGTSSARHQAGAWRGSLSGARQHFPGSRSPARTHAPAGQCAASGAAPCLL